LRENFIQVPKARTSLEDKDDKIELLYSYLSGPEFKQRFELMVSNFIEMKDDLDKEKRSIQRLWSKREKSLEKIVLNVADLYGDMQGIIGTALPTISTLELPEIVEGD